MTKNTRFPRSRQRRFVWSGKSDEYDSQWRQLFHCQRWLYAEICVSGSQHEGYRGVMGLTSAERQRLKSWNVKIVNCAAVTISFARLRLFAKASRPLWKNDALDSCVSSTGRTVCSELHIARQRITIVSNSDIIRINAVPVRSTTTG